MPTGNDSGDLFKAHVSEGGGEVTVALEGELDLASVDEAKAAIRAARERGDGAVVVDLRRLAFFGSVGLRSLVEVSQETAPSGRRLILVPNANVRRLLDIAGVSERFDIRPET
jgi:anti-sigma B factor antagonist